MPEGNDPNETSLLEARGITKVFGGLVAVNSVDFDIPERSIVSLIGPNGAGKTTFFNMVSGLFEPSSGAFVFKDKDITRLKAHQRAQMGIGRTFQNIRLFGTMSALDNVLAGMHTRLKGSILGFIFGVVLVLMMLLRPEGIFPNRQRQEELRDNDPGTGDAMGGARA